MKYCEKCGSVFCRKRTDMIGEPMLCDECYKKEVFTFTALFIWFGKTLLKYLR